MTELPALNSVLLQAMHRLPELGDGPRVQLYAAIVAAHTAGMAAFVQVVPLGPIWSAVAQSFGEDGLNDTHHALIHTLVGTNTALVFKDMFSMSGGLHDAALLERTAVLFLMDEMKELAS